MTIGITNNLRIVNMYILTLPSILNTGIEAKVEPIISNDPGTVIAPTRLQAFATSIGALNCKHTRTIVTYVAQRQGEKRVLHLNSNLPFPDVMIGTPKVKISTLKGIVTTAA